jgi:hypothetical protein
MSFQLRNLHVLAYASGHTTWLYKPQTTTLHECCAPGHFQDATDMLADRDIVTLACIDGGAMRYVRVIGGKVTLEALR